MLAYKLSFFWRLLLPTLPSLTCGVAVDAVEDRIEANWDSTDVETHFHAPAADRAGDGADYCRHYYHRTVRVSVRCPCSPDGGDAGSAADAEAGASCSSAHC